MLDIFKYEHGGPSKYLAYAVAVNDGCVVAKKAFKECSENDFDEEFIAAYSERGFGVFEALGECMPKKRAPNQISVQFDDYFLIARKLDPYKFCFLFKRPEKNESLKRYESATDKLVKIASKNLNELLDSLCR